MFCKRKQLLIAMLLLLPATARADFNIVGAVNNRIGNAIAAGNILAGPTGQFIYGEPFALSGNKGRATVRSFDTLSAGSTLLFTISGNANADRLGMSVAMSAAGSLNPRVAAGAINDTTKFGYVKVYSANGTFIGTISGGSTQFYAESLAIAHDLNGDDIDDIVVGASSDTTGGGSAGKVTVYSGVSPFAVIYAFVGSAGDRLGAALATGDVNQDGIDDIIVGATGEQTYGAVHVYSGANGSAVLNILASSVAANALFGRSVSFAGDVNSDGTPDIVVGSRGSFNEPAGNQLGAAHVIDRFGNLVLTVSGDNAAFEFGTVVSGGADFDGDGISDFAVSSPLYSSGGNATLTGGLLQQGRVQLFRGPSGSLFQNYSNNFVATSSLMGTGLAANVDINADGVGDILLGSPYYTNPPGSLSSYYHGRVDFIASLPPTATPTALPTLTATALPSPTSTAAPIPSLAPTLTPSPSPAATQIPSQTPDDSLTATPTQVPAVEPEVARVRLEVSISKKLRLSVQLRPVDSDDAPVDVTNKNCEVRLYAQRRAAASAAQTLGVFPFSTGTTLKLYADKIPLLNLIGKRGLSKRKLLAGPFVNILGQLSCAVDSVSLIGLSELRQPLVAKSVYQSSLNSWAKKVRSRIRLR